MSDHGVPLGQGSTNELSFAVDTRDGELSH